MSSKYVNVDEILKKYEFEIDTENIKDLTCVICHKILINAHNGPCGCRYCFECIRLYLEGDQTFCPGPYSDCMEQTINLNEHIFKDQAASGKIARLIMTCPHNNCNFKDELKKIEEHILICDAKSISCPFSELGCIETNISKQNMKHHLSEENFSHIVLMVEWMRNIKNDQTNTNKKVEAMTKELKAMKEALEANESEITQLQETLDNLSEDVDELYNYGRPRFLQRPTQDMIPPPHPYFRRGQNGRPRTVFPMNYQPNWRHG